MSWHELYPLAEKASCITPVYLYDHSIQSVSTCTFFGRAQHAEWDSGQVGWIYATHDQVKAEYGSVTPETLEKAKCLLAGEVKEYDYYLTGQCYGFQFFEGEDEIDSCWSFLGEIRDIQDAVKDYLPSECKDIVEMLQYRYDDLDIEDYLEELQKQNKLEDEYDKEF